MRAFLKAFIKKNRWIYKIYYHLGSFVLRVIGLFIKVDPDLILFISYGGQKFDDSPRVLYEYLVNNRVSEKHRYVWAFIDSNKFPEVKNRVKVDTLKYYITAIKAGYWITNSSASRGLNFRKRQTKNYLFTHGMTGIKKIGTDIGSADKAFIIGFVEQFDGIFIEGKKEIPILAHAWQKNEEVFYTTGLPRNDDLVNVTSEEVNQIKIKLNIPLEKKVILYAPTFREFSRTNEGENILKIPIDFEKWEKELGKEYVLVITAHYEVSKLLDELPAKEFVVNAFKYPQLNDLLKVADILISDYSSVVFDYSILEKPIICYGYDYEDYVKERGIYTDLEKLFSNGVLRTENEVIQTIKTLSYEYECVYTKERIKEEYIASYGDAAEKATKIIFKELDNI